MPLDSSSKRRSSVGLLSPWQVAPPSPTDTPGVLDQADREQIAWTYSGILAEFLGVVHGPLRVLLSPVSRTRAMVTRVPMTADMVTRVPMTADVEP